MNTNWRMKVSRSQKIKSREEMSRAKLKEASEKYFSHTKECNEAILNSAKHWAKKLDDLEEKKSNEGSGIDEAMKKLTEDFKRKIARGNEAGRKTIDQCRSDMKKDLAECEKQKENQNDRWIKKYRRLEQFWNKKLADERIEGGHKVQAEFRKKLSRCHAMGRKEKTECDAQYKQCTIEGKGYHTRMKGHEKLEKIAIKMKREADRNFAVMKRKYEGKLDRYKRCVRETEALDAKHGARHRGMAMELEGILSRTRRA
eukprot:TRINITY_DN738_c0_g3_i2.p1 TRINITY_DN738_c0_g3~~TRINITY_DN738_c0_g3_i2.p1  ORF type:complete len:257 (-),score=82.41 TRINITY_DN738_c0_g3_i2:217-987(-)